MPLALAVLCGPLAASAQDVEPRVRTPEIGPAKGSLVIVGGGLKDPAIVKRFIELAGGDDAPIVVIPTAGDGDDFGEFWPGLRQLKAAGASKLRVLHTRDPKVANSEEFASKFRDARGVWFIGGRQWRLADAYLNTRAHAEMRALLGRGGVIGGTSAGATIQGSFLVRGDTKGNETMIGDHVAGLAFLKNVAIDQHLLRRNRQFDLLSVIEQHPELLGIGIDEDTAVVVQGDRFEVMGAGYVAIYDSGRQLDGGGRFYFLAPGDRFNLKTRDAERPQPRGVPLERVRKDPWTKH